jgi:hypothetical protein
MADIRAAAVPHDLPVVRLLFREYIDGLGVDLSFQDVEAELAGLPGRYAAPSGRLLLAWRGDEPIGYARMRLDTLPTMDTAQALYGALGFVPAAPYGFNPIPGTQFLALDLRPGG